MSSNHSQPIVSTLSISPGHFRSTISTLTISSNDLVQSSVHDVYGDAVAIANALNVTYGAPVVGPVAPHQGDQGNEGDIDAVVDKPEEPSLQQARSFLDRMSLLVDMSHLPRGDLNQIARYIFDLSQEAGLPILETEHLATHLLAMGNQYHWNADKIKRVAGDVIKNLGDGSINQYGAAEEGGGTHFFVAPLGNTEDVEVLRCIKFQFINATHVQVEVLIPVMLLHILAYGGLFGVGMVAVIVERLICTHPGPITSVAKDIRLRLLDQVAVGWKLLAVRLMDVYSIASVSIDVLSIIAYALVSIFFMYMLIKGMQATAQIGGQQA